MAAMAPALTEAASQAGKFTLPHFPASSNIPLASTVIRPSVFIEKVRQNVGSQPFDVDGSRPSVKNFQPDHLNSNRNSLLLGQQKIRDSVVNHTKDPTKLSILTSQLSPKQGTRFVKLQRPVISVKCGISLSNNGTKSIVSESKKGTQDKNTKCCLEILTMNKGRSKVDGNMGLINANPSVNCDLKGKIVSGSRKERDPRYADESSLLILNNRKPENGQKSIVTPFDSEEMSLSALNPSSKLRLAVLHHISREKRAEQLLRRIQRLQAVQSERHVRHQMKAFVSHEQKKLGIPCQLQEKEKLECSKSRNRMNAKAELLKSEGVKNLSTSELVNLVRRLETAQNAPSEMLSKDSVGDENCGKTQNNNRGLGVAVKLDSAESSEISQVTGMLKANLWHLQSAMDSDATESSSGGESCDECDGFDDDDDKKEHQRVPLHKRASWSWAVDRAAVISRWMWLQAQVSDLEYRIRQHSELFRQLRLSKGSVLFQDDAGKRTVCQELPLGVKSDVLDRQVGASLVTPSIREINSNISLSGTAAGKAAAKPVNGFVGSSSISLSPCNLNPQPSPMMASLCSEVTPNATNPDLMWTDSSADPAADSSCIAARTRAVRALRKRHLLKTSDLHMLSKKAAKLSTVRCNCCCQSDVLPCTLCGGRYNNVQTVDPDVMPTSERVSLLDPSFHPVLSFPRDVPLTFHFEVQLRREKMGKQSHRSVPSIQKKSRLKSSQNYRSTCKLARNAAQTLLSSAKLRNTKKHCSRRQEENSAVPGKSRKQAAVQMAIALKRHRERRRALSLASSGSSRPSSPLMSPASPDTCSGVGPSQGASNTRSSLLNDLTRRKRGESEFDINNIVIPYSIAAATRVERLQYKEILTPKWRYVEDQENETTVKHPASSDAEKMEDISDEAFAHRHLRCEIEEKKRFMSYLPSQHHGRSRLRSSRVDSHADSSGANTPDPISPHSLDILSQDSFAPSGMNSPMVTPPATPCPVVIHSDDSQPSGGPSSLLPSSRPERKRSTSFCKRERAAAMEDLRLTDEDRVVIPYEPRSFPLTDEEYQSILNTSSHLDVDETTPSSSANAAATTDPTPNNEQAEFQSSCNLDNNSELSSRSGVGSEMDCDANDPDWSVSQEKQPKQATVPKLAKR